MTRASALRAAALGLVLLTLVVLGFTLGAPDVAGVRARVEQAGAWGPALYFALYVLIALVPCPKALLTAAGGALFGMWIGAGLALGAALIGAVVSFALGRALGREAVDRLIRGRLAEVDDMLRHHGLAAVLVLRLVPLVPYLAINYASGLTGVRVRHYVLGSAVGMVPGSLAYAALGAYGTNPWGLAGAVSALVVLVGGGAWWARRLRARQGHGAVDVATDTMRRGGAPRGHRA
ncbi:MAG: VTT domain-containing protein [Microbacterium sp.]